LRPARQIPTHRQKRKPEEISHDVSDYWEYFLVQEDFLSRRYYIKSRAVRATLGSPG